MIFAENFQLDRQRFVVKLQRLGIVALSVIHQANIVVTRGGLSGFRTVFQVQLMRYIEQAQSFLVFAETAQNAADIQRHGFP